MVAVNEEVGGENVEKNEILVIAEKGKGRGRRKRRKSNKRSKRRSSKRKNNNNSSNRNKNEIRRRRRNNNHRSKKRKGECTGMITKRNESDLKPRRAPKLSPFYLP